MAPEAVEMFGSYIKECRIKAGLTQQQLGELCGYTGRSAANTVQKWEYDQNPVPLEKMRILAKTLNIPIESLIP